jgi:hypothetical protein
MNALLTAPKCHPEDRLDVGIQMVIDAIGHHLAGVLTVEEWHCHYPALQSMAGDGLYETYRRACRASDKYDPDTGDQPVFAAVMRAYGVLVADTFAKSLGR